MPRPARNARPAAPPSPEGVGCVERLGRQTVHALRVAASREGSGGGGALQDLRTEIGAIECDTSHPSIAADVAGYRRALAVVE